MKIQEKDIDLIEKYLEGRLQGAEADTFQQRMREEQEFRQVLEEMETMVSGIRYTGRRNTQSELEKLEASLPALQQEREAKVITMRRFRIWAAAASVLLVAVTAIWLFTGKQMDEDQLFNAYYQPYANVESPTTRSAEEMSVRQKAYYAYDSEDYKQAIALFELIPATEAKAIDNFYLALCHLSTGNAIRAQELLTDYLEHGDEIMKDKAQWYLAMATLNQGNTVECIELLEMIVTEQSFNFKKASGLLEELK